MPLEDMKQLIAQLPTNGMKADCCFVFFRSYDDILTLYQAAAMALHSAGTLYIEGPDRKSKTQTVINMMLALHWLSEINFFIHKN